jgi:flavin reductase (DIM6/NTAB) family NADH-FMN oxidoreductase RutF
MPVNYLKKNPMRKELSTFEMFSSTMELLGGNGILLVAGDPPNPMTIGWGTLGIIWGRPVFTVLVRPTRYTYQLIENSPDFSVNVLSGSYRKQLAICGSRSGRDMDKIRECGFSMEGGIRISTPYIAQSDYHYECSLIHRNRIDPSTLEPGIIRKYYPVRDFHTVYYGEILGVFSGQG